MKKDYKEELGKILDLLPANFIYDKVKPEPSRRWRFDYADQYHKIAIEYEGLAYRGGKSGHTTLKGFTSNCEKYNAATINGWKVLRFTAEMVQNGTAERQLFKLFNLI